MQGRRMQEDVGGCRAGGSRGAEGSPPHLLTASMTGVSSFIVSATVGPRSDTVREVARGGGAGTDATGCGTACREGGTCMPRAAELHAGRERHACMHACREGGSAHTNNKRRVVSGHAVSSHAQLDMPSSHAHTLS